MRILYSANSIWSHTGYGIQGKYLLPRLKDLGHEVAQFAWYGLQGAKIDAGGLIMYPCLHDPWGSDIIGGHVHNFQAEMVISLQDIWVLPPDYHTRFKALWAPWFPVDHKPIPPRVAEMAKTADYPLVYSKFGLEEARRAGIENVLYIPHGVDTKVFCPGDKDEARLKLGLPKDAYIVDMVAANKGFPSRKALCENILGFKRFRDKHPDAFLYLHMEMTGMDDGVNLLAYTEAIGLPKGAFKYVPQYHYLMGLSETYLADVYRASDVHLAAACAEGFGLPILEAQACGTPVITTNWTSMPELTWAGIAIEPYQLYYTPLGSWIAAISVDAVREALEEIFRWGDKAKLKKCAFAVKTAQEYDWDRVARDYWGPFLAGVEQERGFSSQKRLYETIARRDAEMPRSEADAWYNMQRRNLAMIMTGGLDVKRMVDLGCAEGQFLQAVAPVLNWRMVGVDISETRIAEARKALGDKVRLVVGDALTVGDDATYDLVVAMELIEHVPDPQALLANIYRILVPGGHALIATPNDPDGKMVDGQEHLRGYGFDSLAKIVDEAGFLRREWRSTPPGIFGPEGLLAHPETLDEFTKRREWDVAEGSNLYVLVQKPEAA